MTLRVVIAFMIGSMVGGMFGFLASIDIDENGLNYELGKTEGYQLGYNDAIAKSRNDHEFAYTWLFYILIPSIFGILGVGYFLAFRRSPKR